MDFIERLLEFSKALELPLPIKVGMLDTSNTLSIAPMPGGKKVREFYDGTVDKILPYDYGIKSKDHKGAIDALTKLSDALTDVDDIPSKNGSYEFSLITVSDEPFFIGEDDKGFFFYRLRIMVHLTIYKG